MSIQRINTILLHTWYHFLHSMETWVDLFWNSAIQIAVMALIARSFSASGDSLAGVFMIMGMVFWNVIWVGQYGVTIGALWEIWSHSLSNMFISPLTLDEFLAGQMISSFIKSLAAVTMAAVIAYFISGYSIFAHGWVLLIVYAELLVFSWAVGMLVLSLIFRYGTDVQSLSWALVFFVQPFGGVFFPVSILPMPVRAISYVFPTTYIFEALRSQITGAAIEVNMLVVGGLVCVAYLVVGYLVLTRTYEAARESGRLARMEG